MSRETLGWIWDGSGTLKLVQNGSGYPRESPGRVGDGQGGPGWVGGTLGKSGTCRGTIEEGPGRVGGHSRMSGTGRGTHGEVRDGSWDLLESLGKFMGPSDRSGTSWVSLPEVCNGSGTVGEVRDGSEDPPENPVGGLERVGGPSRRSRTFQRTLG